MDLDKDSGMAKVTRGIYHGWLRAIPRFGTFMTCDGVETLDFEQDKKKEKDQDKPWCSFRRIA
jgi:hypothetical protein